MYQAITDVVLQLFELENRLIQILAEGYILATFCFLILALGCIGSLCLAEQKRATADLSAPSSLSKATGLNQ